MTVVIGTAGHIDHGKTSLLRALTGMDADRLPDEKRRGLTIDVGYARGAPDGGAIVDYVDVPGHDRLVGNMLVGAGEIDGCLLVVAADDGPRAQTLEHLELLDALGIDAGVAAITKTDLVDEARVEAVRADLEQRLARTRLAGAPIVAVSSTTGGGIDDLRAALADLRDRLGAAPATPSALEPAPSQLAIDRVFRIRGHGVVVTGTARGAPFRVGDRARLLPYGAEVRVRGIQVHDASVPEGPTGGRVALNLGGIDRDALARGHVIAAPGAAAAASDRLLVLLRPPADLEGDGRPRRWPPRSGVEAQLHIGTDQLAARVVRGAQDTASDPAAGDLAIATLTLERPTAAAPGLRFVLRQPDPTGLLAGGVVLDPAPPRGPARRRRTAERIGALADAVSAADRPGIDAALLDLHGIRDASDGVVLAADVGASLAEAASELVRATHAADPEARGISLPELRIALGRTLRRAVAAAPDVAADAVETVIGSLAADGLLVREGDVVRDPAHRPPEADPARERAAARLVELLDVPAPPGLTAAAREAGCDRATVIALERDGAIVAVEDDLAWSRAAYEGLVTRALDLARAGPMTPAALRDATGTSRKYVMALLEDLARRGILTRTPAGHVPGPRAPGGSR